MITEAFDNQSPAIINPCRKENAPKVDACIMTFSYVIEKFVLANYECEQIASFWSATGITPNLSASCSFIMKSFRSKESS